jgi:hypothetical protein
MISAPPLLLVAPCWWTVDAHAGGVDHDQFAVEAGGDCRQQPVPHPGLPPADEPGVTGCRWPIAVRNLRSRCTRPETPQDAVQHPPVINPGTPRGLSGSKGSMMSHSLSVSSYRRRAMRPRSRRTPESQPPLCLNPIYEFTAQCTDRLVARAPKKKLGETRQIWNAAMFPDPQTEAFEQYNWAFASVLRRCKYPARYKPIARRLTVMAF